MNNAYEVTVVVKVTARTQTAAAVEVERRLNHSGQPGHDPFFMKVKSFRIEERKVDA